jgi:hypothetical protein
MHAMKGSTTGGVTDVNSGPDVYMYIVDYAGAFLRQGDTWRHSVDIQKPSRIVEELSWPGSMFVVSICVLTSSGWCVVVAGGKVYRVIDAKDTTAGVVEEAPVVNQANELGLYIETDPMPYSVRIPAVMMFYLGVSRLHGGWLWMPYRVEGPWRGSIWSVGGSWLVCVSMCLQWVYGDTVTYKLHASVPFDPTMVHWRVTNGHCVKNACTGEFDCHQHEISLTEESQQGGAGESSSSSSS